MTAVVPSTSSVASHAARVLEQGWTVLEDAIEPELVDSLRTLVRRLEEDLDVPLSNAGIEGRTTRRMYNLLAKDAAFRALPTHPSVLPVVEAVLDEGCLLSGMTTIDIGPGERAQSLHTDDVAMDKVLGRPHAPMSVTCIWALTDFTASNGGTRFVPGSHLWAASPWDEDQGDDVATEPLQMAAGSVMVFHGSLWHGGGPNDTPDEWRLGAWVQYCHGFIRQQQNPYVGIPLEVVREFPDRLLELSGYGLYRGIMGHVDGISPADAALGTRGT